MDLISIGLGLLVLATIVVAFLASKSWHWAHVLVVVGLVFASVGYVFLLTPSMTKRTKWQKTFVEADKRFEQAEPTLKALQRGTDDAGLISRLRAKDVTIDDGVEKFEGVRTLQERSRIVKRLRGRFWIDGELLDVDGRSGESILNIPLPKPLGLDEGALVFVFESGAPAPNSPADGAQYLGEFRVSAVDGQQVTLQPALGTDKRELDRISRSRGPWVVHESMPVDDPRLFAGLPEEELRALIPEEAIEDYLREGTPWTSDDPEGNRLGFDANDQMLGPSDIDQAVRSEYRRKLRDYTAAFQEYAQQQIEMTAERQALEQDNAKLAAALKTAKELTAIRNETGRKLRHDLDGVKREREAIEQHLAALERQVDKAEKLLAQTLASNSVMASELAAAQESLAGRKLDAQPVPSRRGVDIDAL